jgi:hypothetical protein
MLSALGSEGSSVTAVWDLTSFSLADAYMFRMNTLLPSSGKRPVLQVALQLEVLWQLFAVYYRIKRT